jgi:hypothetical protein
MIKWLMNLKEFGRKELCNTRILSQNLSGGADEKNEEPQSG